MEDYRAAFEQRNQDTEALYSSERKVAAMHFGGITVECLLKSLIFANLPKHAQKEWKTDSNAPGHTYTNPGHSFQEALRRNNVLNTRVSRNPKVRNWIKIVENPNQMSFIDMRYSSSIPHEQNYKEWWFAYTSLRNWLLNQTRK